MAEALSPVDGSNLYTDYSGGLVTNQPTFAGGSPDPISDPQYGDLNYSDPSGNSQIQSVWLGGANAGAPGRTGCSD